MGKDCIQGGHLIALTLSESTARKIEEDHATGRLVASEPSSCMTLRSHAFPPARTPHSISHICPLKSSTCSRLSVLLQ